MNVEYQLPGEKWCREWKAIHAQDHVGGKWVTPGYFALRSGDTRLLACGK